MTEISIHALSAHDKAVFKIFNDDLWAERLWKFMKRFLAIFLAALTVAAMAVGCSCSGDDKDTKSKTTTSSKSSSAVSETTKVIETTPDGGTVEEDSEGNVITKDKNGNIISVVDKNGNAVDVEKYKSAHNISSGKTTSSKNSSSKKSSSKSSGSKSSGSSKSSSQSTSKEYEDDVEGEIPTVIASIPSDEEMATAPEIPDL